MQYTPVQPQPPGAGQPVSLLTGKRKFIVLGAVLLLAFGYFGYVLSQNLGDFLNVAQLVERGPRANERAVQVKGRLAPETFLRTPSGDNLHAVFQLEWDGVRLPATYDHALPDLFFNPHSEIVLDGQYSADGVFIADRVLVKCPTKYRSLEGDPPPGYGTRPSA